MIERLRKCMTTNEKYFCELMLVGKQKVLILKVNTLAKELRLSPGTIHDALRILEVAGFLTTEKDYKCTIVKIKRQDLIKKIIEE